METFSRSTTDSIDSIGVFDEEDVILGVEIPNEFDDGEEDLNGCFAQPVLIKKRR
jgi:hypothetical protein